MRDDIDDLGPAIRAARPDEFALLRYLHTASVWCAGARGRAAEEAEAHLRAVPALDRDLVTAGRYFVAEADGEIRGGGGWSAAGRDLASGNLPDSLAGTFLSPTAAIVRGFFVAPEASAATARALLRRIEDDAVRTGCAMAILVASPDGADGYREAGYGEAGPLSVAGRDEPALSLLHLAKHLGTCLAA